MPHSTESLSRLLDSKFDPAFYRMACGTRREVIARLAVIRRELDSIQEQYEIERDSVECLKHDIESLVSENVVSLGDYSDLKTLVHDATNIGANVAEQECGLRNEQAVLEARLKNINDGIKFWKDHFRKEKRKVVSLERFRSKAEGLN